jgi:hypothetical protein
MSPVTQNTAYYRIGSIIKDINPTPRVVQLALAGTMYCPKTRNASYYACTICTQINCGHGIQSYVTVASLINYSYSSINE